jgi:aquaporin Z
MECVNCATVADQAILLFYSMRAMPISISEGNTEMARMYASFKKNRKHYLQEALGLAIFMISACFFSALLEGKDSALHLAVPQTQIRALMMGLLMGSTALFIFYSPLTAPSGSHINPAVTLVFLRMGKICRRDAFFYILFQMAGGLAAVYLMVFLLGHRLTNQPVHYATTVPGKHGVAAAATIELVIAFIMMSMVLFTSNNENLRKFTRPIAGLLVCLNVVIAGPVSGFGMNPARTLASAIPANTYTAFWIYMIIPVIGMFSAAEFFLFVQKKRPDETSRQIIREYLMRKKLSK